MILSLLHQKNRTKRIVAKDIEGRKGARFSDYENEFEYLINAGIALEARAISNPSFPLMESASKNLLKLYMNDVGLLSMRLYKNNFSAILDSDTSINLGNLYETVAAEELKAHGFESLYYYDNKSKGEVDFLIDDYNSLSVIPLEIKSGKSIQKHNTLTRFMDIGEYNTKRGYVLSNEREVRVHGRIVYIPIYFIMFLENA